MAVSLPWHGRIKSAALTELNCTAKKTYLEIALLQWKMQFFIGWTVGV